MQEATSNHLSAASSLRAGGGPPRQAPPPRHSWSRSPHGCMPDGAPRPGPASDSTRRPAKRAWPRAERSARDVVCGTAIHACNRERARAAVRSIAREAAAARARMGPSHPPGAIRRARAAFRPASIRFGPCAHVARVARVRAGPCAHDSARGPVRSWPCARGRALGPVRSGAVRSWPCAWSGRLRAMRAWPCARSSRLRTMRAWPCARSGPSAP